MCGQQNRSKPSEDWNGVCVCVSPCESITLGLSFQKHFPLIVPLLNASCVSSVCEYLISFHLNNRPSLSSDAEDVFDGLCLRAQDVSLDKDLKSQYQIMRPVDT